MRLSSHEDLRIELQDAHLVEAHGARERAVSWRDEAACTGARNGLVVDPAWWDWPSKDRRLTERAVEICATCPVRAECIAEAGVWWKGHREHGTSSRSGLGICGGMVFGRRGWIPVPLKQCPIIVAGPASHPKCGTPTGANRHYRRKEELCSACREVVRVAGRRRYLKAKALGHARLATATRDASGKFVK